ncbi:hypothetical protein TYRP_001767 [Tyrophagus putrescentiae]|nr:hypothetical protein TYRP_001767 [Tyrophagus putrescentiae]
MVKWNGEDGGDDEGDEGDRGDEGEVAAVVTPPSSVSTTTCSVSAGSLSSSFSRAFSGYWLKQNSLPSFSGSVLSALERTSADSSVRR